MCSPPALIIWTNIFLKKAVSSYDFPFPLGGDSGRISILSTMAINMRHFISSLLIILLTFGLFVNEASAGRFGGGRSFGVQRSHSSLFSQKPSPRAQSVGQRPNMGRWGSVLGGMLVGGLLASLFMGHGLGTGLLSWFAVAAAFFFFFSFLRKKRSPLFQTASTNPFQRSSFHSSSPFDTSIPSTTPYSNNALPGFNTDTFLRAAKVTFIRLQTAYDQKNVHDLMEFALPEVFAEIKMQLDERGDEPNKTDVVQLEAELLDATKQVHEILASVRFTGFIKENNDPMIALDEIWHFRRLANTTNWVVAGIQQPPYAMSIK